MAKVVMEKLNKHYGKRDGGEGPGFGDSGQGVRGFGGPLGLRQDDDASHGRGPRRDHLREHLRRRQSGQPASPKDRDIAMVFQNYALYPHMTVYQNLAFALTLRKIPKAEIEPAGEGGAADVLNIGELLAAQAQGLVRGAAAAGWRWGERSCGSRRSPIR